MRAFIVPAVALGALTLAACENGDRSAEAQTPTAEAEVETELPEEIISDEELQDLANRAAAGAGSATVPTDPAPGSTGGVQTTPGAAGTGGGTTGTTTGAQTSPPAQ